MRDILLNLILPPFGLLILAAAISLWASQGRRRWWLGAFWVGIAALCTPVVAEGILRLPLKSQPSLDVALPPSGPLAVLVPMGGATRLADGRLWSTSESARRAAHGHLLARTLHVPLVLSGGIPGNLPKSEAEITAGALGLNTDLLLLEETSRDTCENAERSAALLHPMGITRVIAVTDASHLPRFMACLRRYGLDPVAEEAVAITDRRGPPSSDWLPGGRGVALLSAGLRAHIGLAWYILTGRIALSDLRPGAT